MQGRLARIFVKERLAGRIVITFNRGRKVRMMRKEYGAVIALSVLLGLILSGVSYGYSDLVCDSTGCKAGFAHVAGKVEYYRVAVVAPVSEKGDYTNPAHAMTNKQTWCPSYLCFPGQICPPPTRCLLKIMPGYYDIETSSLQMYPNVDIEGSGENVTIISGNISGTGSGVVQGSSDAELRFLTVENRGGGAAAVAIRNSNASPKLTNITVKVSGSNDSRGIYNIINGSPIMTNVTVAATGGNEAYGIFCDVNSYAKMNNVNVLASGNTCVGLESGQSTLELMNSRIAAQCPGEICNLVAGIHVEGGLVQVHHSVISGNNALEALTGTIYVANSQILGSVSAVGGGVIRCVGAYQADFVALNTSCQ